MVDIYNSKKSRPIHSATVLLKEQKGQCKMKWLTGYTIRLVLFGFVAAMVLGSGIAKADYTWTPKADMPTKRYQLSTSVVGGKIYFIGGWNAIGEWNPQWDALTRVDEYDPTTDTWIRKADMPTARGYTSTCVVNEKIYVIGGDAEAEPISIVEVYDPATDTWAKQTELPTKRWWFSTSVVDGKIYVIGGNINWNHLSTVEAYNPVTDTWTTKPDMPTARSASSTCVVDGKIYVIGGSMGAKANVEAYDPTTNTWTRKAAMPTARYLLGASFVGGKIYAIGGYRHSINGPIYSTVEVYDPQADTWTRGVDIPVATAGMSTSVVDGKIYVMGGTLTTHDGEPMVLTSGVYASDAIVDFNRDGIVDIEDLVILIESWGTDNPLCDIAPPLHGDSIVDVLDLEVFMSHWGQPVDDPTLIAHYKLDEAEGLIAADSAGKNDATLSGGPLWQPEGGRIGGALQLDGVDDCVIAPFNFNPADGPFSVFSWVKDGAPGQVILSQAGAANWLMADSSDGALRTDLKEPATTGRDPKPPGPPLISPIVVTDGNWHRVGFIRDGINRIFYVDDVQVTRDTAASLEAAGGDLYIGAGSGLETGIFFTGLIDDVRIYNKALSAEEIAALAQ